MQAFYERHYRGWLDEPLPALDGRTPREAAGLKAARPKLIALLKDMENLSARERLDGRPAYDFGWMWGEPDDLTPEQWNALEKLIEEHPLRIRKSAPVSTA